jgi:hypothetical protein
LLAQYRALIAQPGKADMKRWIDERWGEGCEANEDGAFPLLDRDSAACSSSYRQRPVRRRTSERLIVDFATVSPTRVDASISAICLSGSRYSV